MLFTKIQPIPNGHLAQTCLRLKACCSANESKPSPRPVPYTSEWWPTFLIALRHSLRLLRDGYRSLRDPQHRDGPAQTHPVDPAQAAAAPCDGAYPKDGQAGGLVA